MPYGRARRNVAVDCVMATMLAVSFIALALLPRVSLAETETDDTVLTPQTSSIWVDFDANGGEGTMK